MSVTKPFNSVFKLSKPFKAPSFISAQPKAAFTTKATPPSPSVSARSVQVPALSAKLPSSSHVEPECGLNKNDVAENMSMDQEDGESKSDNVLDLPFVGIWEPEYSRKASVSMICSVCI